MSNNNAPNQPKPVTNIWQPRTVWHWLTTPSPSIEDVALRRKSKLLSTFLLILLALFGLLDLTYYVTVPGYTTALPDLGGYIFFGSAYVLNRIKYYTVAAVLTVSTVPIVLFTAIITGATQNPIVTLNFLILGLLLSSILLSVRATVILSAITIVGTLLMPALAPEVIPNFTIIVGPLATLIIGSALTVTAMIHRKQIENDRQAQLREAEERLRAIYNGVNDAIFLNDADTGAILSANRKMREMFGYSSEEATQLSMENISLGEPPYNQIEMLNRMKQALAGETSVFELQARDKTGGLFWIEVNMRLTRIAQQDRILAVVRDITERKQNEAEILREKQFSETLINSLPGVFYLYASDLKLIRWNRNAEVWTGYSPQHLRGRYMLGFHPDEDKEKVESAIQRAFAEGQAAVEASLILKDGRQVPYFFTGVRLDQPEGSYLLGVGVDMTELKQAEQKLRRRNNELTLINQLITATASGIETKAILQIACEELVQLFDLTQAIAVLANEDRSEVEVVAEYQPEGRPSLLGQLIPVSDNSLFEHMLNQKTPLAAEDAQNDPRLASVRELLRYRGTVSALICPIIVKGEVVGGLSLGADKLRSFPAHDLNLIQSVSEQLVGLFTRVQLEKEQQELELQYQQAQKMETIGKLTAGIAHDFNNLLTAINGFADLLQFELAADDPHQEMVDKILHSGQRAADLVRQLLTFSRKQITEPQVLDINTIVTELDKMLYRIIGEDVQLTTHLSPDLWWIKIDPTQIEQVIINLVVNARDAMPDGGQLSIETANIVRDEGHIAHHLETQPGEYVQLTISDTGHGISEEVKAHIFEPFFTTKSVGKGTGLGLATVFGIVKQGGGSIWVYSEVGIGATFRIHLPCEQKPAPFTTPAEMKPENLFGNETILLAEDDDGVRDLAKRVLQAHGYTLLIAQEGQEALSLATAHQGDINMLLTDVIMPGMSGKTLAEKLTAVRPISRVLFMSGYSDDKIVNHGILDLDASLLQKPFSRITLARKVREVLDSR